MAKLNYRKTAQNGLWSSHFLSLLLFTNIKDVSENKHNY